MNKLIGKEILNQLKYNVYSLLQAKNIKNGAVGDFRFSHSTIIGEENLGLSGYSVDNFKIIYNVYSESELLYKDVVQPLDFFNISFDKQEIIEYTNKTMEELNLLLKSNRLMKEFINGITITIADSVSLGANKSSLSKLDLMKNMNLSILDLYKNRAVKILNRYKTYAEDLSKLDIILDKERNILIHKEIINGKKVTIYTGILFMFIEYQTEKGLKIETVYNLKNRKDDKYLTLEEAEVLVKRFKLSDKAMFLLKLNDLKTSTTNIEAFLKKEVNK